MMLLLQVFDPYIDMGTTLAEHADRASLEADLAEHLRYWQGMVGHEFPEGTTVVLNADHVEHPSVYFLTITVPEAYAAENGYPVHQTDVFHVLPDDVNGPEGDVSEVDGHQCAYCGRVNVIVPGRQGDRGYLPEGVVPVWRQDPSDTGNVLCDECADARLGVLAGR